MLCVLLRGIYYDDIGVLPISSEGEDADIVVIETAQQNARHVMVAGELVMTGGMSQFGREGTFLTTERGISAVEAQDRPPKRLDLSQSLLYRNW